MGKDLSVPIFSLPVGSQSQWLYPNQGSWLKTTGWLQGPLSLSSFRRRIKWILGTPGGIVIKRKLSPRNGSAALRHLTLFIKGAWSVFPDYFCFVLFFLLFECIFVTGNCETGFNKINMISFLSCSKYSEKKLMSVWASDTFLLICF